MLRCNISAISRVAWPSLTSSKTSSSRSLKVSIDDFGTGYSSLSYLQRFPIDILKIAKPFVEEVGQGADRSALARAIVGLGDTLKLQTIAEGIERDEELGS